MLTDRENRPNDGLGMGFADFNVQSGPEGHVPLPQGACLSIPCWPGWTNTAIPFLIALAGSLDAAYVGYSLPVWITALHVSKTNHPSLISFICNMHNGCKLHMMVSFITCIIISNLNIPWIQNNA